MNKELIIDVVGDLLRRRVRVAEDSQDFAFLTDLVAFAKTWGTPECAFMRRPPKSPQFMSFTVNGQPIDPAMFQEMMNGQAQNFGDNTSV